VADRDDVAGVRQRELQRLVRQDAAGVREAKQAVVREHRLRVNATLSAATQQPPARRADLQAQRARVEERFVGERAAAERVQGASARALRAAPARAAPEGCVAVHERDALAKHDAAQQARETEETGERRAAIHLRRGRDTSARRGQRRSERPTRRRAHERVAGRAARCVRTGRRGT